MSKVAATTLAFLKILNVWTSTEVGTAIATVNAASLFASCNIVRNATWGGISLNNATKTFHIYV